MLAEFDTRCDEGYAPGRKSVRRSWSRPGRSLPGFCSAREKFEGILAWFEGQDAGALAHGDLEAQLEIDARELLRAMLQGHLDLRAEQETRIAVVRDSDGVRRGCAEAGRRRPLASVFGEVWVSRTAYRARGERNLCPADGLLNLPVERHSHGLRRHAAIEAARGSYDDAVAAVGRATGQTSGQTPARAARPVGRRRLRGLLQGPTLRATRTRW